MWEDEAGAINNTDSQAIFPSCIITLRNPLTIAEDCIGGPISLQLEIT